ncbi:MAG: FtsX-like permease family protein [Ferruginibacter sp.]
MFKNYFLVAVRSFWRNKAFSAINISGLAIGISASLVIFLLIKYHFTFDKFEKDGDRIYRVVSLFGFSGEVYRNSGVTAPMANAVRNELTGIDEVVPFRTWNGDVKISVPRADQDEPAVYKHQKNVIFAGREYFQMVKYEWISGSPGEALSQPYQVVVTESKAKQYYPKLQPAQALGKEIYFNDSVRATITGIVKDLQQNTDFTFAVFVSKITLEKTSLNPGDLENWNNTNGASQLFLKLSRGTSPLTVQAQIAKLYSKNKKREPGDHSTTKHLLQPLKELHFDKDYGGYDLPLASKPTLYGLLAVAVFLLLLGCINFINLTTAKASQRAKEIGVRKTLGSSRKQLIVQIFSETLLLTILSTLLSVILTPVILKAFSGFIPEGLHFNFFQQPIIFAFLLLLIAVVTLLSALYPALLLSGYKPVLVLKNQAHANSHTTRNAWLRKSLSVSQFVIAQVLIMATILVSKQINYSLDKNMGFKKDAIVHFETNYYDTVQSHKTVLLTKLQAIPGIHLTSLSTSTPSSNNTWSSTMKYKDGKKEVESDVQQKFADTNYIGLYQMKLLAGSNLRASDTVREYLVNETLARTLGFNRPEDAVGKLLEWSNKQILIVGVVADFHQKSLHEQIKPLAISTWANSQRTFNIALMPQNGDGTSWKMVISKIEKAFKEVYPEEEFEYSFLDDDIAKYYEQEQHIASLLKWSTCLAVFISSLGLLGLVVFTTTQRTKEIGVRKVLGATVAQIVSLLSKDFLKLIVLAFIIAIPLAWYGANEWLKSFEYRTNLSWWVFFSGGIIMLLIASIVLSFRTFKAAAANPVKSLRTE